MKHKGLNQLLCAAVVNDRFCKTLLRDPAQAIAAGYSGHSFALTPAERDMVLGIRAAHVEEFAAQVYCWLAGNGHEDGGNGNRQNRESHNGASGLRWSPPIFSEPVVDLVRVPVLV